MEHLGYNNKHFPHHKGWCLNPKGLLNGTLNVGVVFVSPQAPARSATYRATDHRLDRTLRSQLREVGRFLDAFRLYEPRLDAVEVVVT